jgi:hypothetical protein
MLISTYHVKSIIASLMEERHAEKPGASQRSLQAGRARPAQHSRVVRSVRSAIGEG